MTVSRSTHVASNDSILFLFMAGVIFNCIYVKVIVKVFVAQSFLTLCDPMDCSPPGSSVHGILQARILEWVAILFSRGSSWQGDWIQSPALSVQFSSFAQSCLTLCDPVDCITPGFPVHHQLLGLSQTHVHRVGDAIQPSHPLSSPFPPSFSLRRHQGLFQWVTSSHQVPKVLEFQLPHQSFQSIFRTEFHSDGVVGYPCSPRDSQESSPTLQFKTINSSVCSFLYSPTLTSIHDYWKNHNLDKTDWCWQSNVSAF